MALFATETWTMRHRLLLTIGAILVVCQLISVFWLWHESKEQIQLLVASAIEGHNNQRHVEHEVREAVASLLVPSLLIIGLALYISLVAVKKITRPLSNLQSELESRGFSPSFNLGACWLVQALSTNPASSVKESETPRETCAINLPCIHSLING